MKSLVKRTIGWALALVATLFVCHVSARLHHASDNYVAFKIGPEPVEFRNLVLYAAHLYMPPSYNACINNLRQLDGVKQQWALEHAKKPEDTPTWEDLSPYVYPNIRQQLWCPHGGL